MSGLVDLAEGAFGTGPQRVIMGEIQPFARQDAPDVARLFHRILRKEKAAPEPAVADYLAQLFLDPPHKDPDIHSLVHRRDDGSISGFIGIFPLPYRIGDKTLRGAVCGTYMVDNHAEDPFAGARLLRSFLNGPQDISLTETANDLSLGMWRKLGATALPDYSLEWLRVLKPAGFMAAMAGRAFGPARLLSPLVRPVDAVLARRGAEPKWTHLPDEARQKVLPCEDIDDAETARLVEDLSASFDAAPQWNPNALLRMVKESADKPLYGPMRRCVVTSRGGKQLGLFQYHGKAGDIGRALQMLALPGQAGAVLDSMVADAHDQGLVALRGRAQPPLMEAMLGRRFAFVHASSSIVHAKDSALVEPFRNGTALFNGFAGESWCRLLGGDFG